MRRRRAVFADSFYWIAILDPRDRWHRRALAVSRDLAGALLVTAEACLFETLNFFAARHAQARDRAAANVGGGRERRTP